MIPRRAPARLLAVGALAAASLLASGCSDGRERPEVSAVVEGQKIASSDTEALVDAYFDRLREKEDKKELPRDKTAKLVLDYQIKLAFLQHLAKGMGVSAESTSYFAAAADALQPEVYEAIGLRRTDFARELEGGQLSKGIAEKLYPELSVSESAVREEYDRRAPGLDRNWKATIQVARFPAEEPARQVRQRVQQGEAFDHAVTALHAEGLAGVEINPVVASVPANVLDAIGLLAQGEVSDAIPTTGGRWLAVLVQRRQDLPKLSFEDLRGELTEVVTERQRSALFQEWFAKQFVTAHVTVDPYYGKWNAEFTSVR